MLSLVRLFDSFITSALEFSSFPHPFSNLDSMLALTILNELDVGQRFDTPLTAWLEAVFESSLTGKYFKKQEVPPSPLLKYPRQLILSSQVGHREEECLPKVLRYRRSSLRGPNMRQSCIDRLVA